MTDKKIPELIDITTGRNIDANKVLKLNEIVSNGLSITPQKIQEILNTSIGKTVIVSTDEASQLIFDYIVFHLEKQNISMDPIVTPGVVYLVELMSKFISPTQDELLSQAIDNPYYTHWANLGEYKIAGDVSVYKYLFWESGKRDSMKREDYIGFAVNGYYQHFQSKNFAKGVGTILPHIAGISRKKDFFRRDLNTI